MNERFFRITKPFIDKLKTTNSYDLHSKIRRNVKFPNLLGGQFERKTFFFFPKFYRGLKSRRQTGFRSNAIHIVILFVALFKPFTFFLYFDIFINFDTVGRTLQLCEWIACDSDDIEIINRVWIEQWLSFAHPSVTLMKAAVCLR